MAGTSNFLGAINECLDICNTLVVNPETTLVDFKRVVNNPLVDKGGTESLPDSDLHLEKQFDASNPDTWPESIKQADRELRLVMDRMANPESIKTKVMKPDLKVKLVKGHSGAILRSSTRKRG